jgi:hypothetical protein
MATRASGAEPRPTSKDSPRTPTLPLGPQGPSAKHAPRAGLGKWKRQLQREIEREHKRAARAKLVGLREQIRDAKAMRRSAIVQTKERCRVERLAARARAREMRRRALEELREALRRERAAARDACVTGLTAARAIADEVQRARAELAAERSYQRELKRIERANRAARLEAKRSTRRERRGESDEEVAGNIPPEFLSLWQRVKSRIRGSDRMTRTEAFMQYAHDHPAEVLTALDDRTEEVIRELEARERSTRRELRRGPPREVYAAAAEMAPF